MADPNLFVDPDSGTGDYVPCEHGVELHMSIAPGAMYAGTAMSVIAQGDAPKRVAIHAGGAPPGYTLFKESHDEIPASNFPSQLRLNIPFPKQGPISVTVSCSTNGGMSLVKVDPTVTPRS